MKIKTIIIEDEPSAQDHLKKLLSELEDQFHIEAFLSSVQRSIEYLEHNATPDIIFMDIHLSDGSAFKIFQELEINCPIIYTTAYDNYAIEAFKTNGISYLLKPITKEDLKFAIEKLKTFGMVPSESWFIKHLDLINSYNTKMNYPFKERFLLKSGKHITPVKTSDIAYFFRDEIVFAKCFNGDSFPVDESLNMLQELVNPAHFIRLNRQLLVNSEAIKKLTSYKPGRVKVELVPKLDKLVFLSQERTSYLKQFLDT